MAWVDELNKTFFCLNLQYRIFDNDGPSNEDLLDGTLASPCHAPCLSTKVHRMMFRFGKGVDVFNCR